ncbi:hypothetical protein B0188_04850 [[Haemophilus] felis]|uniref:Uncharacterized protein n=1 Tax=[Haemophilus] felis TaxID=123822 RepID=A0A1T0B473_9PAST|nr:hypothetical protein B0188_04850 [[Haemophilus] felis]
MIKYTELLDEKGKLTFSQLDDSAKLLAEDQYVNSLIQQHQKDSSLLNSIQKSYLHNSGSQNH